MSVKLHRISDYSDGNYSFYNHFKLVFMNSTIAIKCETFIIWNWYPIKREKSKTFQGIYKKVIMRCQDSILANLLLI